MRKILLPVIFVLLSFIGASLSASDRDIALAYLRTIGDLWDRDRTSACRLIDDALTYDSSLSGLWLFQGLCEGEEENLTASLQALERAYEENDWEGADYDRFLDTYFPLLLRFGQYEQILDAERTVAYHRVDRREVLLAVGWARFFLGDREGAKGKGRRGLDFYPGDWRFYSLAIATGQNDWIPSLIHYWGEDSTVMDRIFQRLYRLNALPEELDRWYRDRDTLSAAYLDLYDRLRAESASNLSRIEAFLDEWHPDDLYLLMRLFSVSDRSGRELLNRYMIESDFVLNYDGDGDNIAELELTGENVLCSDRDSDGLWDTEIYLDGSGKPRKWITREKGSPSSVESRFFEWPLVSEVVREGEKTAQLFEYLYPRFSLLEDGDLPPEKAFSDRNNPLIPELADYILRDDLKIPFSVLLKECRLIEESKEGRLTRLYHVTDGEIYGIEEDTEDDGRFSRQVLLEGGSIAAARRDLNGDGTFDLFEYYEKGVLKGYAVNLDGDTQSDFFEDWDFIPLKIWDYDGDSLMDGYLAGPYGENIFTLIPHREDPRNIGDYISWERRFEAQWYR